MKEYYNISLDNEQWFYEFSKNLSNKKRIVIGKLGDFPPVREDFLKGYDGFSNGKHLSCKRSLNRFIRKHLKEFKVKEYEWYETRNGNYCCYIVFTN